jgi:hypothetical protein
MRNTVSVFVAKHEGKRPHERSGHKWEGILKYMSREYDIRV